MMAESYTEKEDTFETQVESLYSLSKCNGDLTLIIVPLNGENKGSQRPTNKKHFDINSKDASKMKYSSMKVLSVVLMAASPVFKNVLGNVKGEGNPERIQIVAPGEKDVDDLYYFMCTNKLRLDTNAMNMIQMAHYFQMKRLFEMTVQKLIKDVTIDNFVQTVKLFDEYHIVSGYHKLVDFGLTQINVLRKRPDFDDLPHSFKYGALRGDCCNDNETQTLDE